jgi:uncharacterized membrane protein
MKKNIFVFIIILLSLIVSFYFYPQMDDKIASNWDREGNVSGYISKTTGTLLIPIIMVIIYFLFTILPKIDPLKKNILSFKYEFDSYLIFFLLFLFYIHILIIFYNIGITFNLSKWILPALGILIYRSGILISRCKKNWFIGIKTPWTLSNDFVWDKTHRVSGNIFKISGILIIFSIFVFKYAYFFLIGLLTFIIIFVYGYSYIIYKNR